MAINRVPFNALVDDDGSNTKGTPWNKQAIKDVILDPVDAALPSVLLGHAFGIAQQTAPTIVSTIGMPVLTTYDTIQVEVDLHLGPLPPTPVTLYYNGATNIALARLDLIGGTGDGLWSVRIFLRRHATDNSILHVLATGGGAGAGLTIGQYFASVAWTVPFNLFLQHGGVPAGGFMQYKWSVTKIAG